MKHLVINIILLTITFGAFAQKEFHVYPENGHSKIGSKTGDGSLENPWDLQTALQQSTTIVNGGDTIWLHEGIYDGRFVSTLKSTVADTFITVAAYQDDHVILNGNVASSQTAVLEVQGDRVIFKDFEVTFLGDFSRDMAQSDFQKVNGITHLRGEDCQFINLKIHNNPGSGMGSWKGTGGTLIDGCIIFNNGYFSKVRGSGAGIYVQNASDKMRIIQNCIIFNNYYMGIEAWSAAKSASSAYIKNITIRNNIVFNSGLPANHKKNNIIVATNDRHGVNRATNIQVLDNVLYHNTNFETHKGSGDAGSLTLGHNYNAPLKNVTVSHNIIVGGNNALRLNTADHLTFENNTVYGGYVHLNKQVLASMKTWSFNNNTYHSKRKTNFRIVNEKDYMLPQWQSEFQLDRQSTWQHISAFNLETILDITPVSDREDCFRITLFEKNGNDVKVDFKSYNLAKGTPYVIKNVATNDAIHSGQLPEDSVVTFPMGTFNDTASNFGVYVIQFGDKKKEDTELSFLTRFFKWLF